MTTTETLREALREACDIAESYAEDAGPMQAGPLSPRIAELRRLADAPERGTLRAAAVTEEWLEERAADLRDEFESAHRDSNATRWIRTLLKSLRIPVVKSMTEARTLTTEAAAGTGGEPADDATVEAIAYWLETSELFPGDTSRGVAKEYDRAWNNARHDAARQLRNGNWRKK